MSVARNLGVALAVLALAGCAGGPAVRPFSSKQDTRNLTFDEKGLWKQAEDQDKAFARSGATFADPRLDAYLQSIVDRVYPEFKGTLHVHALKSTDPNAFMMANGSAYVQLGLLNQLQDEAQLATVLAHEGAHFLRRHSYREHEQIQSAAVFGAMVGLAGIPLVGNLVAYSSIYGYSRDMEHEADMYGLAHLRTSGYDVTDAAAPFVELDGYVKALDIDQPYFFASHPKLKDRITYFEAATAGQTPDPSRRYRERYLEMTAGARLWVLKAYVGKEQYKAVIYMLEGHDHAAEYAEPTEYFLARAYLQRGKKGDGRKAIAAFEKAIAQAPGYAPDYAALGKEYLRTGKRQQALAQFERYLAVAPDSGQRKYIEQYVNTLQGEKP